MRDAVAAPSEARGPAPDTTFRHARHASFGCLDCHTMQSTHGELLIRTPTDCRGCHHTGERLALGCAECHRPEEMLDVVVPVKLSFSLSVRDDVMEREIVFDHAVHAARLCVECHTEGPTLADPDLDCQGCHQEHHAPANTGCPTCHREPPPEAHTLDVHVSCATSGCHVDPPIEEAPRSRVGCLWCHSDKSDHEPEGQCVDCHFVSAPIYSQRRTSS